MAPVQGGDETPGDQLDQCEADHRADDRHEGEPSTYPSRWSRVRLCGTITAMGLKVRDSGYLTEIGIKLSQYFRDVGVLVRPLGNPIYVLPPYYVTDHDLSRVYEAIAGAAAAHTMGLLPLNLVLEIECTPYVDGVYI